MMSRSFRSVNFTDLGRYETSQGRGERHQNRNGCGFGIDLDTECAGSKINKLLILAKAEIKVSKLTNCRLWSTAEANL